MALTSLLLLGRMSWEWLIQIIICSFSTAVKPEKMGDHGDTIQSPDTTIDSVPITFSTEDRKDYPKRSSLHRSKPGRSITLITSISLINWRSYPKEPYLSPIPLGNKWTDLTKPYLISFDMDPFRIGHQTYLDVDLSLDIPQEGYLLSSLDILVHSFDIWLIISLLLCFGLYYVSRGIAVERDI